MNTTTEFVISRAPPNSVTAVIQSGFLALTFLALFVLGLTRLRARYPIAKYIMGAAFGVMAVTFSANVSSLFGRQQRLYGDYAAGKATVLTGCLQHFSPSQIQGHTPDQIEVAGRAFSYADYSENGGFHLTAISGGPVRADSWVRLYALGDTIVRVDVAPHACPSAPAF